MDINTYTIQQPLIEDISTTENISEIDKLYNNLTEEYYNVFLNVIKHEELEEGYLSKSEILYKEIAKKYGYVLASNFINAIYKYGIQHNDLKVLLSILKIISNISNENEIDNFSIIAISLFKYNNIEIIDEAISCFEKWGRKEDAELLKNFEEPSQQWLAEYYRETISYLEGLE